MIKSWGNGATRRFYATGKSKYPGLDVAAAEELVGALDEAISLSELSPLKSVGLHKLKGDLRGMRAMTINGPWRLCCRFEDGDAYDVTIVDYH